MLTRWWSNSSSRSWLVKTQNGTATWEGRVVVSHKINPMHVCCRSHSFPKCPVNRQSDFWFYWFICCRYLMNLASYCICPFTSSFFHLACLEVLWGCDMFQYFIIFLWLHNIPFYGYTILTCFWWSWLTATLMVSHLGSLPSTVLSYIDAIWPHGLFWLMRNQQTWQAEA